MALLTKRAAGNLKEGLKVRSALMAGAVSLLWIPHLINTLAHHSFDWYGVHPRTLTGLWGILFAPFLHANWDHLIANTVSFVLIGWLVMIRRARDLVETSLFAMLTAGLGTWLVGGAYTVHLGASGVVFGLFGFLLTRGIFERKALHIAGSITALVLFGGMLRGVLPGIPGISWESHLFGFLGGILAARFAGDEPTQQSAALPTPAAQTRIAVAPSPMRIAAHNVAGPSPEGDDEVDAELEALRRKMGR